jgi:FkbM family methyltransferase
MTPYILLEQGDWFEDEIHFVRKLLKTGDEVIDIGANYGAYTMSMAQVVGASGKVWAFEPASLTALWLRKSVDLNAATQVTVVEKALSSEVGTARLSLNLNAELNSLDRTASAQTHQTETITLSTLDAEMEGLGMLDPVFVKLDAEGEELRILKGGEHFFERFDPLVMFELKHGNAVNTGLIEAFVQRGFDVYRLIPGADILVPVRSQAGFDQFQLNLFACRKERARQLNSYGRLVFSLTPAIGKATHAVSWRDELAKLPYARAFPAFSGTQSPLPGADEYQKCLDAWCSADAAATAEERVAWLDAAWRHVCAAVRSASTSGRVITRSRIARAIGLRTAAAETLHGLVGQRGFPIPDEPFLAPGAFCENEVITQDPGRWLNTRVLESLERLKSHSGYFLGMKALETYEALAKDESLSPALRRRIDLAMARFGRVDYPF